MSYHVISITPHIPGFLEGSKRIKVFSPKCARPTVNMAVSYKRIYPPNGQCAGKMNEWNWGYAIKAEQVSFHRNPQKSPIFAPDVSLQCFEETGDPGQFLLRLEPWMTLESSSCLKNRYRLIRCLGLKEA